MKDTDHTLLLSPSPEKLDLSKLKIFKAAKTISKDVFLWLWQKISNIEQLQISQIVEGNLPVGFRPPEVVFERGSDNSGAMKLQNLFKINLLKKATKLFL